MSDGSFRIRQAGPSKAVIDLAKTMHEASQRAGIRRAGYGTYISWELLPNFSGGQQELWIAAAEAAFAHLASSPAFPLHAHMPGGICG